jgi:hypothetical protein
MKKYSNIILIVLLASLAGCPKTNVVAPDAGDLADALPPIDPEVTVVPGLGETASAMVGPSGGELSLGSLKLDIPTGALTRTEEIRVTVVDRALPPGFTAYTPVFHFEPAGLVFDVPARIVLPFEGDAEIATIFWTEGATAAFTARRTTVEGSRAQTEIAHFSEAFVGTRCEDSECCGRATSELDMLLMVDNSNSMTEEQYSLAAELPRMARALATGDVDGDGVQDFPAVADLHLGIVSSDMGTGGYRVPTCAEPNFGDDGVLRNAGNPTVPGCSNAYPNFLTFVADDPLADPDAFAADAACVARMGTGGCGFEQPLEATLKAVTRGDSLLRFVMDTAGHGTDPSTNGGFLRADSVFATLLITDEDDCSAADPELFNIASTTYTENLNLRCHYHGDTALHPLERYVDGFLALRDPSRLVYAAITGIPTDLSGSDHATILDDPRMQSTPDNPDPSSAIMLEPVCNVPGRGIAFPARRLVGLAQQLESRGAATIVRSICQADFSPAVTPVLEAVAHRLSGICQ